MKNKKTSLTLFLGALVVLLIFGVLYLTLRLSSQQTKPTTKASAGVILSLTTPPSYYNVGDAVVIPVLIDPSTHAVSLVKLVITYDSTLLQRGTNGLVPNSAVFPTVIEGPIYDQCSGTTCTMSATLSIGSDVTKAITTPQTIATLNFQALAPTAGTAISFDPATTVYSLSSTDGSAENVLSSASPLSVVINGSTTATLTPTVPQATDTPTVSPSPVATSTPTSTPTPTPISTRLNFNVFLHSIGHSGDNASSAYSLSNQNPLHPDRNLHVLVLDAANTVVADQMAQIHYSSVSGNFTGTLDLGVSFPSGPYNVKLQADYHLRRLVPGIQIITTDQTTVLPPVFLTAGDANTDNGLNILDYNIFRNCFSIAAPPVACTPAQKLAADFNDDGAVDGTDYTLFIRELSQQNGD